MMIWEATQQANTQKGFVSFYKDTSKPLVTAGVGKGKVAQLGLTAAK